MTRTYRIVADCTNAETGGTHRRGEILDLTPDSVLVRAGCARPVDPVNGDPAADAAPAAAAPASKKSRKG